MEPRRPAIDPIPNFAQVDLRVWRGAAPNDAQAASLVAAGVQTVINLEWEASDTALANYRYITYVRIRDFEPLPWFAPSLSDEHVIAALRAIRAGPPLVYVHCRSGENRTGVIVAAYRIIERGDSLDPVLSNFQSYRGFWAWGDVKYIRTLYARRDWFLAQLNESPHA